MFVNLQICSPLNPTVNNFKVKIFLEFSKIFVLPKLSTQSKPFNNKLETFEALKSL